MNKVLNVSFAVISMLLCLSVMVMPYIFPDDIIQPVNFIGWITLMFGSLLLFKINIDKI